MDQEEGMNIKLASGHGVSRYVAIFSKGPLLNNLWLLDIGVYSFSFMSSSAAVRFVLCIVYLTATHRVLCLCSLGHTAVLCVSPF